MIHKVRLNLENKKYFTSELLLCITARFVFKCFLDLSIAKYIKSQLSENK